MTKETGILVFIICTWWTTNVEAQYSVKCSSEFPFPVDTPFLITVNGYNGSKNPSHSQSKSIVIRIADRNGKEKERTILKYESFDAINEFVEGDFVDVQMWVMDPDNSSLNITIVLKKKSNSYVLELYTLEARSTRARLKMFRNVKLEKRIFSRQIDLLIPSKLELLIDSSDKQEMSFVVNQLVLASCRAFEGAPVEIPNFSNIDEFDVNQTTFLLEKNERRLWFNVRLVDHLKKLTCSVANKGVYVIIKVFHATTEVGIEPDTNQTLLVNSTISCYAKDGHPPSHAQWYVINGPHEASRFYEMNRQRNKLSIKSNAPTETKWTLTCSSKNINKTISFVVAEKQCDNICLNKQTNTLKQNLELLNKSIISLRLTNDNKIEELISTLSENNIQINQSVEILKEIQTNEINKVNRYYEQINKSIEMWKERQGNQLKILQESIDIITKKYDLIVLQNKAQINQIKNILDFNINLPDYHWSLDTKTIESSSETRHFHWHQSEMKITAEFQSKKLVLFLYLYVFVENIKFNATVILYKSQRPQEFISDTKLVTLEYTGHRSPPFIFNQSVVEQFKYKNSIVLKVFLTKL